MAEGTPKKAAARRAKPKAASSGTAKKAAAKSTGSIARKPKQTAQGKPAAARSKPATARNKPVTARDKPWLKSYPAKVAAEVTPPSCRLDR